MTDSASDLFEQLRVFRETHQTRWIKSAGLEWEFISSVSGPSAVILLPEGGGNAEDMFSLMTALEQEFNVIAVGCPDEVTNVPDIVQAIAVILDSLGVQEAFLLGHSLGGMFAECFMLKYPERTSGLILANVAHFSTFRETFIRGALSILPHLPRPFVERHAIAALKRQLANTKDAAFWVPYLEFEIAHLSSTALANRASCMVDAIERYPMKRIDLDTWKRRVLILESDNDTAFTPDECTNLRGLYADAQVHVFRGAGHFCHYTRPLEVAAVVTEFLNATGS
jgi:esterase